MNNRQKRPVKRWTRVISLAPVILALSGWQPGPEVAPTSPAFEQSLTDSGLLPLSEAQTTALLSDATIYATYVLTRQSWIEYYDRLGAVVRTRFPRDSAEARKGRPMLFGSWWGDNEDICFAYGLSRYAECYRLYYHDETLFYIQTISSPQVPAGALLAHSTAIRKGNVEEFPLLGN